MERCNWGTDGAKGVLGNADKELKESMHRPHSRPKLNLHEFKSKKIRNLGDFGMREYERGSRREKNGKGEKGKDRW